MGLLDDIKKLRARAESLNNKHIEAKKSENGLNNNGSNKKTEFEFKESNSLRNDSHISLSIDEDILDPRVEEKPRVDSKLQAFRNQSKKHSSSYEKKLKKKKSNFFKKPYIGLHDQSKKDEVKENFYESFNIKILILIISVILIFALLRIETSFRNSQKNKVLSGAKFARVPNDNNAYYLEKSLIISTGMFTNLSKAKLAQNSIKDITEQESKIIKIADYYTIQIGGHYFDKEDAFYVLNELSTSGIKDISLRLQ